MQYPNSDLGAEKKKAAEDVEEGAAAIRASLIVEREREAEVLYIFLFITF